MSRGTHSQAPSNGKQPPSQTGGSPPPVLRGVTVPVALTPEHSNEPPKTERPCPNPTPSAVSLLSPNVALRSQILEFRSRTPGAGSATE